MDSLKFYGDHLDENESEEAEGETRQLQPHFSVNEVKIEVVSVVVETQQLEVETQQVEVETQQLEAETQQLEAEEVVTFENSADHKENDHQYVEGHNDLDRKDLDEVEIVKGESAHPNVVLEAEEGPKASMAGDQAHEFVDLNGDTQETDLNITGLGGDESMAEQDEAALEEDTEVLEASDEDTAMLQQPELGGEHALTFAGVANKDGDVDLNASDMVIDDYKPLPEPALESAAPVSYDEESAGDEAAVNNNANEKQAEGSEHVNANEIVNADANEPPLEGSEHDTEVDAIEDEIEKHAEASEHPDSGKKETNLEPEDVNNSDDDNVQSRDSDASKEIPSISVGRGSASTRSGEMETKSSPEDINKRDYDGAQAGDTVDSEEIPNTSVGLESASAPSGKEDTSSIPEDVNKSDHDSIQAGDTAASEEIPNIRLELGSASASEQLFNDVNLSQLKAQILVMGILRKGSKPSDDLLKSACPTSISGTPTATVVEDDDDNAAKESPARGEPSSSRKRKSLDSEIEPPNNDGIATNLMMTVKDSLRLSPFEDNALLLDDADRQLRSAQISAHDAMATTTSALAQSHIAWVQIQSEDHRGTEIASEQRIASVVAIIAAAASVATAAVEAAKAISNVSMQLQRPNEQSSGKGKTMSFPTRRKSDLLASVVKAAGMAADAATQAGALLTSANTESGMEGLGPRTTGNAHDQATRGVKRKSRASPKTKSTKKSKGHVSASPKTTPRKVSKSQKDRKRSGSKRSEAQDSKSPALAAERTVSVGGLEEASGGDIKEQSESISKGSAVEIMTDEEGLRGGWFSGKALKVTVRQAYAVYDELLDDSGVTKIKEWFPFKASEDLAGPRRQVRPVHPYGCIREAGSKKRRRVSLGSQTWAVGDRVDAYIQDAWWEGILVELNDIDENIATVYFPGENDTQVVKGWDLRPSMQWEDGKWVPWANSVTQEDELHMGLGKVGSSGTKTKPIKDTTPKLTSKPPKSKETRKETQGTSVKAGEAKDRSKKKGDATKAVDETLHSRSTRQGNTQPHTAIVSRAKKKSIKIVAISDSEGDEPTPSRLRKGLQSSANIKKGKPNPRILEDPIDVPTSTRSTRSSPGDAMMIVKDTGAKVSTIMLSEKSSSDKKRKDTSKVPQKDVSTLGTPKKLDLNVNTVKTAKKTTPASVATNTRGNLKGEKKRTRPSRRR